MGYLTKSFKVRRHKRTMRIIATAALAGCVYERRTREHEPQVVLWGIIYPDGQISLSLDNKRLAAVRYMKWFLGRHDALAELKRRANV